MATTVHEGPRTWKLKRGGDGHRDYTLRVLVDAGEDDGPANVLQTPGLPLPGSVWEFRDDVDVYAYCTQEADVSIHQEREGDSPRVYAVDLAYTTKPTRRCSEEQFEDPLLEPPRLSGSYVKYTQELTHDVNGMPITNSAWEQLRGPQLEFDRNRPQVKVSMNVAELQWEMVTGMLDTLNDAELWGFPARCVKLSDASWEEKWRGQCEKYYTWNLTFDLRKEGFDRYLLDEGTKVLNGQWNTTTGNWELININGQAPDRWNPAHFIRAQDKKGDPMKVVLDGAGQPVDRKTSGEVEFATDASPIVITSAAHGVTSGDLVAVSGVLGNTNANGLWSATVTGTGTFELHYATADDAFWAEIIYGYSDSTGNGTFDATAGPRWVNLSSGGPGRILVQGYASSNFLLLGVPTEL